jgi:hypothetical protein
MAIARAHGGLLARRRLLNDGRVVTVRRAVPSDARELTFVDADVECVGGIVALDDHGAIVGHAGVATGVAMVEGWSVSGLAELLADCDPAEWWPDRTSRADFGAPRRCDRREP